MNIVSILDVAAIVPKNGGVDRWPDLVDSTAMFQTGSTSMPSLTRSSNGSPALSFDGTNDWMWMPLNADRFVKSFGVAFWMRSSNLSGLHSLFMVNLSSGASVQKIECFTNNATIIVDVYTSAGVSRRGTTPTILETSKDSFVSIEFDGDQVLERDKLVMTVDHVKQGLTFSNSSGTPPDMPAALRVAIGFMTFGVQNILTNLRPFAGLIGNVCFFVGPSENPGGGLMKSDTRRAIANIRPWRQLP